MTTNDKTLALLQAKEAKLETLSINKPETLTFKNNANTVNTLSPAELQYNFGEDMRRQVLTRDDGSKYQFDIAPDGSYNRDINGEWLEKDFSGPSRNLYIDETKQGNMKLGLASSNLNPEAIAAGVTPAQARYMDKRDNNPYTYNYSDKGKPIFEGSKVLQGYDGTPGPQGLTPSNGFLLDVELPKEIADSSEYMVHSNIGQLANRAMGQGPKTADTERLFGAGQTEYSTPNAPMWNIDSTNVAVAPDTVLPKVPRATASPNDLSTLIDKYKNDVSAIDRIGNTARAVGATAVKPFVGTADLIAEQFGGDIGTDEAISKSVDNVFGYDRGFMDRAFNKAGTKVKDMEKNGYTVSGVIDVVTDIAKNPELLGETAGFLLSMMGGPLSAGGKAKTAISVGSKALKAAEASGDIAKVATITNKLKDAQEVVDKTTSLAKGVDFAAKHLGYAANTLSLSSADIDAYAKEAGIPVDDVSWQKKLGIGAMNALNVKVDQLVDKGIIFNPAFKDSIVSIVKNGTKGQALNLVKALGSAVVAGGVSLAKEGSTEYIQELMTQINQQAGTQTGKDLFDVWSDPKNKEDRAVSGFAGVAGATQMSGASLVGSGLKKTAGTVVDTVSNLSSPSTTYSTPDTTTSEVDTELTELTSVGENEAPADILKRMQTISHRVGAFTSGSPEHTKWLGELSKVNEVLKSRVSEYKARIDEGRVEEVTNELGSNEDAFDMLSSSFETEEELTNYGTKLGVKPETISKATEVFNALKTVGEVEGEVTEGKRGYKSYYEQMKAGKTFGDSQMYNDASKKLANFADSQNIKANTIERVAKTALDTMIQEGTLEEHASKSAKESKHSKANWSTGSIEVNWSDVAKRELNGNTRGALMVAQKAKDSVDAMTTLRDSVGSFKATTTAKVQPVEQTSVEEVIESTVAPMSTTEDKTKVVETTIKPKDVVKESVTVSEVTPIVKEVEKDVADIKVEVATPKVIDTAKRQKAFLDRIIGKSDGDLKVALGILKESTKNVIDKAKVKSMVEYIKSSVPVKEVTSVNIEEDVVDPTIKQKDETKDKYSTLTKETIPSELNKLVDNITDEKLKTAIGKWVTKNLENMENC